MERTETADPSATMGPVAIIIPLVITYPSLSQGMVLVGLIKRDTPAF